MTSQRPEVLHGAGKLGDTRDSAVALLKHYLLCDLDYGADEQFSRRGQVMRGGYTVAPLLRGKCQHYDVTTVSTTTEKKDEEKATIFGVCIQSVRT